MARDRFLFICLSGAKNFSPTPRALNLYSTPRDVLTLLSGKRKDERGGQLGPLKTEVNGMVWTLFLSFLLFSCVVEQGTGEGGFILVNSLRDEGGPRTLVYDCGATREKLPGGEDGEALGYCDDTSVRITMGHDMFYHSDCGGDDVKEVTVRYCAETEDCSNQGNIEVLEECLSAEHPEDNDDWPEALSRIP